MAALSQLRAFVLALVGLLPVARADSVYSQLVYTTTCGIIGGVGPAASADFFSKLVTRQFDLFSAVQRSARVGGAPEEQLAAAQSVSSAGWTTEDVVRFASIPRDIANATFDDQHHVPVIIYDMPQIPDRTAFILEKMGLTNGGGAMDPVPYLAKTTRSLVAAGATCVAVTCNTAHYFLPEIRAAAPKGVKVLNMLELTLLHAVRWLGQDLKLGLLSTTGTALTGIYQQTATRVSATSGASLQILTPMNSTSGNQSAVMEAIYGAQGIKAGFTDVATEQGKRNLMLLYREGKKLMDAGCAAVILGCTQIPLVITEANVASVDPSGNFRILNPTTVLVDAVIHRSLMDRHLPEQVRMV